MRSNPNAIRLPGGQVKAFRARVMRHYCRAGRHALPWRRTRNPYRIVVSEIMLQQTRVARVLQFYPRFLVRFPTFRALSRAKRREVLTYWQGLGYNRRAVHLHRLAQQVVARHRGILPPDPRILPNLPGIGAATAGAILAFAFNIPVPFVETNIRRVILHHFFPRARRVPERAVRDLVARTLPKRNARAWYSALMDYGAWLAKETENPNRRHANYRPQPKFTGSSRELRGKIVRYLLAHPRAHTRTLARALGEPLSRIQKTRTTLKRDGVL